MADVTGWVWLGTGEWPSFSSSKSTVITHNGDNRGVDADSFSIVVWHDTDDDGRISDQDPDDATAGGETVTVDGATKTVKEVGTYSNSEFVVDGVTYYVDMTVWVFTDGTYVVSIPNSEMPEDVDPADATFVRLGQWDGIEYDSSEINEHDGTYVCFAAGTHIATPAGLRSVETLAAGDLVTTLDHGPRPLRWCGCRDLPGRGRMAPILIRAGALGNDRDLRLSPQHRILIAGWRAEVMFGEPEVLVPAVALVNGDTIRRAPVDRVTYVHFLFDGHELVLSEGIATESFHPGAYGLSTLDAAAREEVLALFPELAGAGAIWPPARPCLSRREGAVFAP